MVHGQTCVNIREHKDLTLGWGVRNRHHRTISAAGLDTRGHGRRVFITVTMKLCSASARQVFRPRGEVGLLMIAAPGGGKGMLGEWLAAKFSVQQACPADVHRLRMA